MNSNFIRDSRILPAAFEKWIKIVIFVKNSAMGVIRRSPAVDQDRIYLGVPYVEMEQDYEYDGSAPDGRGHWSDSGKLPNHITFSTESGHGGKYLGGKWVYPGDGSWRYDSREPMFVPSGFNLDMQDWRYNDNPWNVYASYSDSTGEKVLMPEYGKGGPTIVPYMQATPQMDMGEFKDDGGVSVYPTVRTSDVGINYRKGPVSIGSGLGISTVGGRWKSGQNSGVMEQRTDVSPYLNIGYTKNGMNVGGSWDFRNAPSLNIGYTKRFDSGGPVRYYHNDNRGKNQYISGNHFYRTDIGSYGREAAPFIEEKVYPYGPVWKGSNRDIRQEVTGSVYNRRYSEGMGVLPNIVANVLGLPTGRLESRRRVVNTYSPQGNLKRVVVREYDSDRPLGQRRSREVYEYEDHGARLFAPEFNLWKRDNAQEVLYRNYSPQVE